MSKTHDLDRLLLRLAAFKERLQVALEPLPSAPLSDCWELPEELKEVVRASLRSKGKMLVSLCRRSCGRPDHYKLMTRAEHGAWCVKGRRATVEELQQEVDRLTVRVAGMLDKK